jgi:hypothetical protein
LALGFLVFGFLVCEAFGMEKIAEGKILLKREKEFLKENC